MSSTTSTHPSVQTASRILETEDLDFQQTGWWFNREYKLTLVPNSDGRVVVPADALDVRISDIDNKTPEEKIRYARRGNYMYDTYKHTDVISTSVVVDIVFRREINSLPAVASSYIMHKAREAMYLDDDGDKFKCDKLTEKRMEAWVSLRAVELRMVGANALDSPYSRQLRMGVGQGMSRNPNIIGGRY